MTVPGHARPRPDVDVRVVRWSSIASLWFVVLVGGAVQVLVGAVGPASTRTPVLVALSVVAVAAATVTIPLLVRPVAEASVGHPAVLVLVLTSVAVWAVSIVPPSGGPGWSFTMAIAGGTAACLLRRWGRVVVLAVTIVLLVGVTDADASPGERVLVGTLVLFTLMPLSVVWVHRVVLRLEDARRTASDLAVSEERLRFATDLHDIQGHHLQVIALKSELAERLLVAEPDRARAELGDIRAAARAALEDTRALVHDYRTVTVAVEVRNAAAVLRSAGIDCTEEIVTDGMADAVGALFAVAIREAATNTIRHSRATTAAIELRRVDDVWRLTVWNDAPVSAGRRASGIAGLRQRIAPHGGTVVTTRTDDRFTLEVRIPADEGALP